MHAGLAALVGVPGLASGEGPETLQAYCPCGLHKKIVHLDPLHHWLPAQPGGMVEAGDVLLIEPNLADPDVGGRLPRVYRGCGEPIL